MSETKTYVVPDGNNNNDLLTASLLSNGNGGFGGGNGIWNNPFIYLVWMWMMRWMNGNGFGNEGEAATQRQLQTLQDQILDNHNSDLIMQAIQGNGAALQDFATRTGCNFNAIQGAVQGVQNAVQSVASQLGFSSERVINAVNQGDCGVIQALKDCCCQTQQSILRMGYENQLANERLTNTISQGIYGLNTSLDRNACAIEYNTQRQTCDLSNTIRDTGTANTNAILAKLDAIQNQGLLDKIEALREKNTQQAQVISNSQQTATFAQMLNATVAPVSAAVNGLQKDVDSIKCQLPNTVTLPYSCATAVPTSLFYNGYGFGAYGYNNGTGFWG